MTESSAIEDIIKGVEFAKRKVKVKSVLDYSLNLSEMRARQSKIRSIIDDVENEE